MSRLNRLLLGCTAALSKLNGGLSSHIRAHSYNVTNVTNGPNSNVQCDLFLFYTRQRRDKEKLLTGSVSRGDISRW